ncbi:2-oxoisovalerate dehydrogenase subunit alpha 2, mitochondrial-like isoform X1 [Nicotiana tabacum]|uniref:2-oxoisovalerate dehydrogenase subunit alpha 2, mitochondrial-like isoform X1 n=2 Tax=Nicotiana TaxID=4085 RepID=A0A1S4ARQ6_TOBAC|nr:PREDICTED: 2-oxoisovalerate dehydrogenase subunit alpha 2, mitochondrial-like isoform X1 [Nicotiana sylvestris]XP_016479178.1 PREDICTED: 2-oxoisovalerate dehydrogenase subunit alpha 2, mitochondrial-like isoform X1 [Nicotiana tabacum]
MKAGEQLDLYNCRVDYNDGLNDEDQTMDLPGGKVPITTQMKFISESSEKRLPCYRVFDTNGYLIPGSIFEQAMTYRVSHHSTSDDSTKYQCVKEIEQWRTARNPVTRFRNWIQRNGWWFDQNETELCGNIRKQVLEAIQATEKVEKPPLTDLFGDIYDEMPSNLHEQEKFIRDTIKRYPKDYPSDVPV